MFGLGAKTKDFLWEPEHFVEQLDEERKELQKLRPLDFERNRGRLRQVLVALRDRVNPNDFNLRVGNMRDRLGTLRTEFWKMLETGSTIVKREYQVYNAAWQKANELRGCYEEYEHDLQAAIDACNTGTLQDVSDALMRAQLQLQRFSEVIKAIKETINDKGLIERMKRDFPLPVQLDIALKPA